MSKKSFGYRFRRLKNQAECHEYGITHGCDINCPVLREGNCKLQDGENAHLWKEIQHEANNDV